MKYISFCLLALPFISFGMQTTYLKFEEPPGWRCELNSGVYVCQSSHEPEKSESLILVFGAPVTDWDSLPNYENYLNQPKTILDEYEKPVTSKVTFVRRRNINGVEWIDSLQQNSELVGFWTRYVATVQKPLAILVTYVVSNQKYSELTPAFERLVASLRPEADFKFTQIQKDLVMPGTELGGVLKGQIQSKLQKKKATKEDVPQPSNEFPWWIVVIGILMGGFVLVRLRKRETSK